MKKLFYIFISIIIFAGVIGLTLFFGNGFTDRGLTESVTLIVEDAKLNLTKQPYDAVNKPIIDAINYPVQKVEKTYEPKVCLIEPNQKHANLVESVLFQFYKADTYLFLDGERAFTEGTLEYARLHDCDIINYSVVMENFTEDTSVLASRIAFLKEFEGIIVASAGNDASKEVKNVQEFAHIKTVHPELSDKVIIVSTATVDEKGEAVFARYSTGTEIDIVIPAENITVSANGYTYTTTGTSAATPAVSGLVALYLSANGKTEASDIKRAVLSSDKSVQAGEFTHPLVDVSKMMKHKPEMVVSE